MGCLPSLLPKQTRDVALEYMLGVEISFKCALAHRALCGVKVQRVKPATNSHSKCQIE
ncbi:hypothetical protein PUN4_180124 [Paraburkholderia unamae]|nr:hypothetical protein PUN4_180124 [Paraburkholderia unamae]